MNRIKQFWTETPTRERVWLVFVAVTVILLLCLHRPIMALLAG